MSADTKTGVQRALSRLNRRTSAHNREGMARDGLYPKKTLGVSVADIRLLANPL